ncbi:MAG: system Cascade subunit CasE [Desulfovibrionales bacterium]|jgi:CRISPR system Cascade subunit CasE|nr:system Cascade subunit CasE [Desulfovibrionales bacterium]
MFMSKIRMTKAMMDTPARLARLLESPYGAHQVLWDLFSDGPDRRRDFLFREQDKGAFLVVSARKPCGDPQFDMETKEYKVGLKAGDRVLFSLRANPVRKTREGERQVRHDIVQDRRKRLEAQGVKARDMPRREDIAREVVPQWLATRAQDLGLDIEEKSLLVESYQVAKFSKSRDSRPVRLGVLDLRGFATVRDPEALQSALFHGVGPAKAFGCGLLLVRRA